LTGTVPTLTYTPESGLKLKGTDMFYFTASGFSSGWQGATIHVVPQPV
jgi:hypothetical protein